MGIPDRSPTAPWRGDLTFLVECRPSRDAPSGSRHDFTIHEDWSMTSLAHDWEAERLVVALGGYCSCLELLRTAELVRRELPLVLRERRPHLVHDKLGHWRLGDAKVSDCCGRSGFRSIGSAVNHLTSARHIANRYDLPEWQVAVVLRNIVNACRPDVSDTAAAARHIREAGGLAELWDAGITPAQAEEIADRVAFVGEPLPVRFFEGIAYAEHDTAWISDVLRYRPDPDTATWLAWLDRPSTAIDAMPEIAKWLGFGIPRQDWLVALERQLHPDLVHEVAAATRWSTHAAAGSIIGWARIGCFPTFEHFALLASTGRDYARPGTGALALTTGDLERLHLDIDRTELGVMLALADHRYNLLAAVQQGARTASDIIEFAERRRSA